MAGALERHIALVGFMGAGKSTLGRQVAERLGRTFVDVDAEVEGVTGRSITQLFEEGEAFFRTKEAKVTVERLQTSPPAVLALGGGALGSSQVRDALRERAFTVHVEVEPGEAWSRVRDVGRPLARTSSTSVRSSPSARRSTPRRQTRRRTTSTRSCSRPRRSTSKPARSSGSAS